MKRLFALHFLFLVAALFISSCSDDDDAIPYATPDTYRPVSEAVQQQNTNTLLGLAVADAHHLYYWTNDTETSAVLCRREKESGQTTVLDRIEKDDDPATELLFQGLYLHGGYLYYLPANKELKRVKADGSAAPEVLTAPFVYVFYMSDHILVVEPAADGQTCFAIDYEGQNRRVVDLPAGFSVVAYYQGRYYLSGGFDFEGEYTPGILSCAADGSDRRMLYRSNLWSIFALGDDCLYITDQEAGLPSLPHPYFEYSIYSLPLEGGSPTKLVGNVSLSTLLAYHDGYLYYGMGDIEVPTQDGLYRCRVADGTVETLVKGRSIGFFNLVADDLIVFLDTGLDDVNRFGTPFETDFKGSYVRALTADE